MTLNSGINSIIHHRTYSSTRHGVCFSSHNAYGKMKMTRESTNRVRVRWNWKPLEKILSKIGKDRAGVGFGDMEEDGKGRIRDHLFSTHFENKRSWLLFSSVETVKGWKSSPNWRKIRNIAGKRYDHETKTKKSLAQGVHRKSDISERRSKGASAPSTDYFVCNTATGSLCNL